MEHGVGADGIILLGKRYRACDFTKDSGGGGN